MVTFVDICCGIGSFHYSFAKHGFQCVLACDIDPTARATYKANYGVEPYGDVYEIDIAQVPQFDILCAGFPCQPFSNAGQHKGFEDTRGTLFFQIMKWVEHHAPKYIVFENVPALVTHDGGNTFKRICQCMEEAGYALEHKLVKCSDYGIPQMRKRLLLIGIRGGPAPQPILDFERFKTTVTLKDYLGKPFEKDTAYTIRCGGRGSSLGNKHNWDAYLVDGKEYRLTVDDGLRLQGFPEGFVLEGSVVKQWHQLGNTIPTVFTDMIAQNIKRVESPPGGAQSPA
jgi:DNA (cytosine-5)-methyltransferase 1